MSHSDQNQAADLQLRRAPVLVAVFECIESGCEYALGHYPGWPARGWFVSGIDSDARRFFNIRHFAHENSARRYFSETFGFVSSMADEKGVVRMIAISESATTAWIRRRARADVEEASARALDVPDSEHKAALADLRYASARAHLGGAS